MSDSTSGEMEGTKVAVEYMTLSEVAERYRTTPATVRYWRVIDYGPQGVKVGRKVLYPMAEIRRFDAALARGETA